jgi:cytochrome c-type biogenesis protein CcmH/NrfG
MTYWLALVVCAAMIAAGSIWGYGVWQAHKANLAEIQRQADEEAKWTSDMADFEKMLVSLNSLHSAIVAVELANTEVYVPDEGRILH